MSASLVSLFEKAYSQQVAKHEPRGMPKPKTDQPGTQIIQIKAPQKPAQKSNPRLSKVANVLIQKIKQIPELQDQYDLQTRIKNASEISELDGLCREAKDKSYEDLKEKCETKLEGLVVSNLKDKNWSDIETDCHAFERLPQVKQLCDGRKQIEADAAKLIQSIIIRGKERSEFIKDKTKEAQNIEDLSDRMRNLSIVPGLSAEESNDKKLEDTISKQLNEITVQKSVNKKGSGFV